MLPTHKLVVVSPFENYKRGDQIFDQNLIDKMSDETNPLHENIRFVRRVLMSEVERQQYVPSTPANLPPAHSENQPEENQETMLKIESIKEEINDEYGA